MTAPKPISVGEVTPQTLDRFLSHVDIGDDGCWRWTALLSDGYGRFHVVGRCVRAHRFSYEVAVGPIPEGLQLDHLCRNTRCVNPDHLEPVTSKQNHERGTKAAMTHCKRGHSIVDARRDKKGRRRCGECDALAHREARRRKAEDAGGDSLVRRERVLAQREKAVA